MSLGIYSKCLCSAILFVLGEYACGGFKSCRLEIAFRSKEIQGESLWQRSSVSDFMSCAVFCLEDKHCRTYSFSLTSTTTSSIATSTTFSSKCKGYGQTFDFYKNKLKKTMVESNIFRICRVGRLHGESCCDDSDCVYPDDICFRGSCLCEPGLYFSPAQNSCVEECSGYGQGMDMYMEIGIIGHNMKDFEHLTSPESCWGKCAEMEFACVTAEWWITGHVCKLSHDGFLLVDSKYRDMHAPMWIFGQRQCK